jgi:phage N-6-adenine-methyltransferase
VLADQWEADALQAIDAVVDPEQAESLLARIKVAEQAIRLSRLGGDRERRWGRVRLLGERRYGELLGPAEHSRRPEVVTGSNNLPAERKAQHEARQVADVPEPVFAEYVETAGQPTRAGLLRESNRMAVHYSSHTDEWATPPELFAVIAREFRFDVDVCALPVSAKCARYFTPEDDGLAQEWSGTCWMNPPYGAQIGRWVTKAHLSADAGAIVVCLVPARTDTGWWWDHCRHAEIRFLRGRLRFGEAETGAPFPSAIVVFGRPARVIWWEPERSLRVAA